MGLPEDWTRIFGWLTTSSI
jgi:hypothetical protein